MYYILYIYYKTSTEQSTVTIHKTTFDHNECCQLSQNQSWKKNRALLGFFFKQSNLLQLPPECLWDRKNTNRIRQITKHGQHISPWPPKASSIGWEHQVCDTQGTIQHPGHSNNDWSTTGHASHSRVLQTLEKKTACNNSLGTSSHYWLTNLHNTSTYNDTCTHWQGLKSYFTMLQASHTLKTQVYHKLSRK